MDGHEEIPLKKDDLNRIHKSMFDQQNRWKENWKDICDYINPYLGFFDEDTPNQGDRRDYELINTSPIDANNTQAAGMQNGITSPTKPWMRITTRNPDIAKIESVRYWCDDVTQMLLDIFSQSNFYDSAIEYYKELGAPATAAMLISEDDEHGIWCRTFTIGEYAIATDHRGKVNRFARHLYLSVSEMVEKFGLDNCPQAVQQQYQAKSYDKPHRVRHLVLPNPNHNSMQRKIDKWSMPYLSFYWAEGADPDDYLEIGGYPEFPFMCTRWSVKGADIYGRGPGWYALGDAKSLQGIDEDVHIGVKKSVDPPVVAPSDILSAGGVNSLPNGVTYYPREMGDLSVRELSQVRLNIADAQVLKQEKIDMINKHFFVDLFRMLADIDNGNITAREIIERVQEKMSLIGPVLLRLQNEFLRPVIDRVFGICLRNGLIPEPPDDIKELVSGQQLKVEYIGIMAQAQKMSGLTAIEQLATFIGGIAAIDPQVMDKWDRDESVDRYSEMLGTPPSLILSDDKVAEIRQARAQQQQATQMAEMAQMAAQGAKTLADTPVGQNSALDALIPGLGGGMP
jgi:hypothetical protein